MSVREQDSHITNTSIDQVLNSSRHAVDEFLGIGTEAKRLGNRYLMRDEYGVEDTEELYRQVVAVSEKTAPVWRNAWVYLSDIDHLVDHINDDYSEKAKTLKKKKQIPAAQISLSERALLDQFEGITQDIDRMTGDYNRLHKELEETSRMLEKEAETSPAWELEKVFDAYERPYIEHG